LRSSRGKMSDGMSTGLGKGVGSLAQERASDEKTTLEQAERWATLLGAQLAATRAKVSVCEPTNGWRAGGGDMTPGSANTLPAQRSSATQRARDTAEAESKDDDRERRRLSRKLNVIG